MRWLISLIFIVQSYVAMVPLALLFFPWALFSQRGAFAAAHLWCRWVRWTAAWMVGIKTEVRGEVPAGEVLIAAKHQSFLDIILIFGAVPRGKFIMKRELLWTPIVGQYAMRIGCVPVHRGRGARAMAKMVRDVVSRRGQAGQLIIYPQGTRVPPGVVSPYKVGAAVLYQELGQPCVPVACNVGLFWPKRGIMRHPGTAVVEFLEPIAPGLPAGELMKRLEREIETRSDALMAEGGFRREAGDGSDPRS